MEAGGDGKGEGAAAAPGLATVYAHVVVVAVLGALVALLWLWAFETALAFLWDNEVVEANPWLFAAICLPFSLIVGLLIKYRQAPTNLDESLVDSLAGDPSRVEWRKLPENVVMGWASLLSGAVLGPEGAVGGIASKLSVLYAERMHIPAAARPNLLFATIGSAYNGIVASPLFTGVFATELIRDADARGRTLPANLIGGAIGYVIFTAVGSTGLQDYLHLASGGSLAFIDLGIVVIFGLVGMALAIAAGIMMRVSAAAFARLEGRVVERALVAGVIFSIAGALAPILMFSGETQILEVVADPAAYGALALVAMALAKLALLAVAFKSGFLGGPVFPSIFASVCVALAIGLLFPGVRLDVIVGGVMAGFLFVLFQAPFMAILLTAVMLGASVDVVALIVVAVAAVMIVQPVAVAALGRARGGAGAATPA